MHMAVMTIGITEITHSSLTSLILENRTINHTIMLCEVKRINVSTGLVGQMVYDYCYEGRILTPTSHT